MSTYTASRISEGNKLFPPSIETGELGLTVKFPSLFKGKKQFVSYDNISSIKYDAPLVGFTKLHIIINGKTTTVEGFYKGDCEKICDAWWYGRKVEREKREEREIRWEKEREKKEIRWEKERKEREKKEELEKERESRKEEIERKKFEKERAEKKIEFEKESTEKLIEWEKERAEKKIEDYDEWKIEREEKLIEWEEEIEEKLIEWEEDIKFEKERAKKLIKLVEEKLIEWDRENVYLKKIDKDKWEEERAVKKIEFKEKSAKELIEREKELAHLKKVDKGGILDAMSGCLGYLFLVNKGCLLFGLFFLILVILYILW